MKRWSLTVWNDWRYCGRGRAAVTFVFCGVNWVRGEWASAEIGLLGFCVSLTRYSRDPVPVESLGREHG